MATIRPDLEIIRGDSETITFIISEDGEPVDLTDATVFFTVKPSISDDAETDDDDASAVIEKEVTSHSDPTEGETLIELSNTDTDIDAGEYYYDIQVKRDDDTIVSIKRRKLTIVPDVTRRTA